MQLTIIAILLMNAKKPLFWIPILTLITKMKGNIMTKQEFIALAKELLQEENLENRNEDLQLLKRQ